MRISPFEDLILSYQQQGMSCNSCMFFHRGGHLITSISSLSSYKEEDVYINVEYGIKPYHVIIYNHNYNSSKKPNIGCEISLRRGGNILYSETKISLSSIEFYFPKYIDLMFKYYNNKVFD